MEDKPRHPQARTYGTKGDGTPIISLLTPEENSKKLQASIHNLVAPAIVMNSNEGKPDVDEWLLPHIEKCDDCALTRRKLFPNT